MPTGRVHRVPDQGKLGLMLPEEPINTISIMNPDFDFEQGHLKRKAVDVPMHFDREIKNAVMGLHQLLLGVDVLFEKLEPRAGHVDFADRLDLLHPELLAQAVEVRVDHVQNVQVLVVVDVQVADFAEQNVDAPGVVGDELHLVEALDHLGLFRVAFQSRCPVFFVLFGFVGGKELQDDEVGEEAFEAFEDVVVLVALGVRGKGRKEVVFPGQVVARNLGDEIQGEENEQQQVVFLTRG